MREPRHAGDLLEQRAEQCDVQQRLHQSDDQPHLVPQRQAHRAHEHEPGLVQETHSQPPQAAIRLVAKFATSQGQEHVVKRRPADLDSGQRRPGAPQRSEQARERAARVGQTEIEQIAVGAQDLDAGEAFEHGAGARQPRRLVQLESDAVARHLALELGRRPGRDDLAVVDHQNPIAQRVGLVKVVGGQEHGHAALVA